MANRKKVLILGGGFGGIKAALELADDPNFAVTLISDQSFFRYYPMLYRTATGGSKVSSEIPLEEIFENKNDVVLVMDVAQKLDRDNKTINTKSGKTFKFDILVVALGVVTNFFGIKGLKEYAYGIKTVEDSRRLRDHLHTLLVQKQKPDINYVIIGGGPTGVELAGALPGYIKHIMKKHGLRDRRIHVDLVEAENRLVPRMPKDYSKAIAKRLRKLGVSLHLGEKVLAETADKLMVTGHSIQSHSVVWAAGVTNHPFLADNKISLTSHGKAFVDQYLQAEPDIFVIGDNADTKYSGMAQTALYDAVFVADHLKRQVGGKKLREYKAKKPIFITAVGKWWAAVLWNKLHFYGLAGWMLRNAADFAGYREYQPWWKAGRLWRTTFDTDEDCPTCKS